ncbi:NAD(P)H-dependent oxidoreductase [Frankia sp. CNm7]|uniref:NAD(P)H-dependent oxidoreductase n=1 Tax=Frankia nepalensis TaxID=1836974 RepID=A0A937UTD9_9ACTN|nr:NAD(P)H-dependent oxidoreductase [Frankia nepalensis]MBL7508729.1 NAD(P)H-dependent oxidoreductase [Frankia nepalensis]MBL7522464.1 NAD(P)H-dependent oxidoreductase [Frankia nepalensis]MBL7633013.1 NAD(P)H-dependent oxidoreductase [Frankia nepalensis]
MRTVVIIGSTRAGRFGPTVAGWFAGRARRRAELCVDVVDLAEAGLPDALVEDGDPRPAPVGALATRLAAADAFVVVTPEYNRSFPAPLKTAIDWFHEEWRAKPVAIVSYGGESGGLYAASQLREVFTELHAVAVPGGVGVARYWEQFTADGAWPKPSAPCNTDAAALLDRLTWWAHALRDARALRPYPAS